MRTLALSAAFLLSLSLAKADLVPVYVPGASTPSAGIFVYDVTYSESVDPTTLLPVQRLDPGSFITLYDIPDVITLTTPAGWTGTIQNPGVTAVKTAPIDGVLNNVTFTWGGPALTADASWSGFVINSTGATFTTISDFTSQDSRNTGVLTGSPLSHVGTVATPTGVPEPASMSLMGGGLLMAGLWFRRRNKR